ncbi:unnamed protein product [Paramecium octaurelia]|uniref:Uncharacterized protein n=1 Tax=Paramecium octaurelia TaxID=43137 RepID=A0A8S1S587_PAROT|nr:unnamed protein product [Paramecium octaurelia]
MKFQIILQVILKDIIQINIILNYCELSKVEIFKKLVYIIWKYGVDSINKVEIDVNTSQYQATTKQSYQTIDDLSILTLITKQLRNQIFQLLLILFLKIDFEHFQILKVLNIQLINWHLIQIYQLQSQWQMKSWLDFLLRNLHLL